MALSTDPEKRARQLAGLRKGREKLARSTLGIGDEPAAKAQTREPTKARTKESQGEPETIRYPKKGTRDATARQAAPARREPERPDPPKPRPGFLDGLFGRL